MKYIIEHKTGIKWIIIVTGIISYFAMDEYVQTYYNFWNMFKYFCLALSIGLFWYQIIRFINNYLKESFEQKGWNTLILEILSTIVLVLVLFSISSNTISEAKNDQLSTRSCRYYDKEGYVIYNTVLINNCPQINIENITENKVHYSGVEKLSGNTYEYVTIYNSGEKEVITNTFLKAQVVFDIYIEYNQDNTLKEYQAYQTVLREIISAEETYYYYTSVFKSVTNEYTYINDKINEITSTRNYLEYDSGVSTEESLNSTNHYNFSDTELNNYSSQLVITFTDGENSDEHNITMSKNLGLNADPEDSASTTNGECYGLNYCQFTVDYGDDRYSYISIDYGSRLQGTENSLVSYTIFNSYNYSNQVRSFYKNKYHNVLKTNNIYDYKVIEIKDDIYIDDNIGWRVHKIEDTSYGFIEKELEDNYNGGDVKFFLETIISRNWDMRSPKYNYDYEKILLLHFQDPYYILPNNVITDFPINDFKAPK